VHKAIRYRGNPHFVFRKGFRTGYRHAVTMKLHLNLDVRKVYFLHSLKVARMASTPAACGRAIFLWDYLLQLSN
jgi:hypothetical protein